MIEVNRPEQREARRSSTAEVNRQERLRHAKRPLDVPCEVCPEMFTTITGAANHMRRVHGIRGRARTQEESPESFAIRQAAVARIMPFAVRGGNTDSETLWQILFSAPRRSA